MNGIEECKEQLADSLRQLSVNWESAKEIWRDAAREEFEKSCWLEFESSTAGSIEKLQDLIDALAQAEREIP